MSKLVSNLVEVAASGDGDLYSDLWVLSRDLDPQDGGGDGEAVLDSNGQIVPIGLDPLTGEAFQIHLMEGAEGDFEVPADQLPFVQEIEMERANIIRSPDSVLASALTEALAKIASGTVIGTDASGRIMVDGVLIDSPRECVALYKMVMTAGGATTWTEAQANAAANLPPAIVTLMAEGWNPTGLLAGTFSKFNPVQMDGVITAHTMLGINEVTGTGDAQQIDYFGFTDGVTETFNYDRVASFGDIWIKWYQDIDGDASDLEAVQRSLLDAVWGSDDNGDGINDVGSGKVWADDYVKMSADGVTFETFAATGAGINDWAQAVEDARAVILTIHESIGATEVAAPQSADDLLVGGPGDDLLTGWGGKDTLVGMQGDDTLEGGDDKDRLIGRSGDDILDGGKGIDFLRGGDGDDTLTGDIGADVFVLNEVVARLGLDTITDYSSAELDVIGLGGIDADAATIIDDGFTFVGYVEFTGVAGELRAVHLTGRQQIQGDVNGDGVADFAINILGDTAAEAVWFAL